MMTHLYLSRHSSHAAGGGRVQDRNIRVYEVEHGWRMRKDVRAKNIRWTITDTALSPDQRFLVGGGWWVVGDGGWVVGWTGWGG